MSLGLIIPTTAMDNFATIVAPNVGNDNNFETYCGSYLNPLAGSTVSGQVVGESIGHR